MTSHKVSLRKLIDGIDTYLGKRKSPEAAPQVVKRTLTAFNLFARVRIPELKVKDSVPVER